MIPTRKGKAQALSFAVVLLGIVATALPVLAVSAESKSPSLTMEELEVKGYRERPDRLYLPVPQGIFFFSPVRLDLFREDMSRPIRTWEIIVKEAEKGDDHEDEYAPD